MKITRCILAIIMMIFLMSLDLVMNTSIHAKTADDLLTFDFEKTTVADALQQIARVTGIKIHVNKPFYRGIVGKSFLAADLEYILRDLFGQENVAIEWFYDQRGLDTVFITIYEKQKDQSPTLPSPRASDYGSNIAGNIPIPFMNHASVLENATKSRENNHIPENREASVPTPVPPVKHGLVPPPPMSPGFLSR